MTREEILLQAQAEARQNAVDDSNDDHAGGIWKTSPIGQVDKNYVDFWLGQKQNSLVSGENIKTINGESLLGGGDLSVVGGGAASPGLLVSNEVPAGLKNGVNMIFTTMNPFVAGSTHLYINGLKQQLGVHYYESGVQQLNIPDSVQSSDILTLDYISG